MNWIMLGLLGLIFGSFVNALVWRIHEQSKPGKKSSQRDLSIINGRSMCPNCKHTLSARDLIPVFSWILQKGKCRYCRKSIGWQYPVVELATSVLFIASYFYWPMEFDVLGLINFIAWLVILTVFMALLVYDFRWMLLPNRLVYPLAVFSGLLAGVNILNADNILHSLVMTVMGVAVAGGIFWLLFQISNGQWIGGGDVKLGFVIGLVLQDPLEAFLMLLTASLLGTFIAIPGLLSKKLSFTSRLPFGPFLIIATIIVYLFGASVISWYKQTLYIL